MFGLRIIGLAAAALFAVGGACADPIGDPVAGKALAGKLCSSCHAIEPGAERSPAARALTFEKIANTGGMTEMALSAWLHSSHPTMPLIKLDKRTAEDISAYILSLKTPRPTG